MAFCHVRKHWMCCKRGIKMEELLEMYQTMGISPAVYAYGEKTIARLKERFDAVDTEELKDCARRGLLTFETVEALTVLGLLPKTKQQNTTP